MDGEVRLFKRKYSKVWQVAFTLDGRQVRVSSKKRIVKDAVQAAREIYLDYRFRQKNGLPVISKRFADVAALCRATMKQQLDNGCCQINLTVSRLIPIFGKWQHVLPSNTSRLHLKSSDWQWCITYVIHWVFVRWKTSCMNAASISVTKQFGFGLNVLGQSLREKSVRIGQGNTRTGNGTWMKSSSK